MNQNQTQRPLLLLDIDGCVNAFDAESHTGYNVTRARGYALLVPSHAPEWILRLEEHFEVVWSTMWKQHAAADFAPVAGFGESWDHIDFDLANARVGHARADHLGRWGAGVGAWKHPGIRDRAADRPAVVVDDDLAVINYMWAAHREEQGIPTLMIQPDPAVGLTIEHFEDILAWAEGLATGKAA